MAAALAAAGIGVGGCARPAPSPASAPPSWFRSAVAFSPQPPLALHYDRVDVRLAGPSGRPLAGAAVTVSGSMPGMAMYSPSATARLRARSPGLYTGSILPTMGGQWSLRVSVTYRGRAAATSVPFAVSG